MTIKNNSIIIKETTITANNGDVIIGGIKVTNIFESIDYKRLRKSIEEWESILSVLPSENKEQIFLTKKKIAELKSQEGDLVETVNKIAKIFKGSEITSPKLDLAKEYFRNGEYRKVNEVLDPDLLFKEQFELIESKYEGQKDLERLNKKLQANAKEFLLKAETTYVDFENKNRYNEVISYFEASLRAYPLLDTRMFFIEFLIAHGATKKAKDQFSLIDFNELEDYDPPRQAIVKGNLGVIYMHEGNYVEAKKIFESVMEIFKDAATHNPQFLNYHYIGSINNLAVIHIYQNSREKAIDLFFKSIKLFEGIELSKSSGHYYDYLGEIASTYNNLGHLYITIDFQSAIYYLKTSISKYQEAIIGNPAFAQPLASSYFNLAKAYMKADDKYSAAEAYKQSVNIHFDLLIQGIDSFYHEYITYLNSYAICLVEIGKLDIAIDYFREAFYINNYSRKNKLLELYKNQKLQELLKFDKIDLAKSLNGIAIFYKEEIPNKDVSVYYAEKAILQFFCNLGERPEETSWTDFENSIVLLNSWGVDISRFTKI